MEILERYERAGILTLVTMPGTLLTIQRKGNTQIARLAHEMGADWVIHNDADEFWWPVDRGNLKEAFERDPRRIRGSCSHRGPSSSRGPTAPARSPSA